MSVSYEESNTVVSRMCSLALSVCSGKHGRSRNQYDTDYKKLSVFPKNSLLGWFQCL